jgi:YD repeat-containing protein
MITFEHDTVGNLLTATDSLTGTITRSYDALNRLVSEVTPAGRDHLMPMTSKAGYRF